MQQSSLTHIAHLLKLQYIHNSSQTSCLIDQFCWIWLPKWTRNGLFQSIFHQIIVKSYPFLRPNSQPAGDTMSLCLCSVVLWRNFSYPNSSNWKKNLPPSTALTTCWLNFFYTHFTLRSVEKYPYFWTSGINLVSQSSQLYKIWGHSLLIK